MKLKKLGFMNIIKEDILSRNEMKNIMAGSGGTGCSNCSCNYNGCNVVFTQCDLGWYLVTCAGTQSGSGIYSGTICGGQCP